MRRRHLLLIALFFALSLGTQTAPLSQQSLDAPMTVVEFQHGAGQANMNFLVPVVLTPGAGVRIGRLELKVRFSKAMLRFVAMDTSGLVTGVDADATTEEMDDPQDPTQRVVTITISTIDGRGASRKPLVEGRLLFITFQFDKELKPNTAVSISGEASAMTVDNPPSVVRPIVVRTDTLEVVEQVISSCFFYMH